MSMATALRTFYCSRSDGLGTRLMSLGWSWRLGRKMDALTVFAWPPTPQVLVDQLGPEMRISSIFDLRALSFDRNASLRFIEGYFEPDKAWPIIDANPRWKKTASALDADALFMDGDVVCYRHYAPLLLAGETYRVAAREVSKLLNSLPLHPQISGAMKDVRRQQGSAGYVAVHFRRGDILSGLIQTAKHIDAGYAEFDRIDPYLTYYARKCLPKSILLNVLETCRTEGQRVYLASDDANVVADVGARFGDIMIQPANAGLLPVQAAMLDIAIQSRATAIYGSHSGFPAAAALLGGLELKNIHVPGGFDSYAADMTEILSNVGVSAATVDLLTTRLANNGIMIRRLETASADVS